MRCFVAIELSDAVRRALASAGRRLTGGSRDVRLTPVEQLHLTLKFLGEVDEARLPGVCEIVRTAAASSGPFDIRISRIGCFPPRGPRVLWAGVRDGGECARWVQDVEGPLAELGFPPDGRPFTPHVTLGRSRNRAGGALIRAIVDRRAGDDRAGDRPGEQAGDAGGMGKRKRGLPRGADSADEFPPLDMRVESVTLFESRLGRDGAVHVPLLIAPLCG